MKGLANDVKILLLQSTVGGCGIDLQPTRFGAFELQHVIVNQEYSTERHSMTSGGSQSWQAALQGEILDETGLALEAHGLGH